MKYLRVGQRTQRGDKLAPCERAQAHWAEAKKGTGGGTHGSNSWMTLSNLKTENSLVEKAEEGLDKHQHMTRREIGGGWSRRQKAGRLTEDSGHREDEQLQQRVLLLVGQTQEAHFGHVGRVRHSSSNHLVQGGGKNTICETREESSVDSRAS